MNEAAKHTPGPLIVRKLTYPFDRQFDIVSDYKIPDGEVDLDRYVAFSGYFGSYGPHMFAAAPEMLEALEALCNFKRDCPCEVSNEELAAWDKARAAIAKAEGNQV